MEWVCQYVITKHGGTRGAVILDEIDQRFEPYSLHFSHDELTAVHRIAAVPPFSRQRRFPQGRGFKQWTGDDSKALMKACIVPV